MPTDRDEPNIRLRKYSFKTDGAKQKVQVDTTRTSRIANYKSMAIRQEDLERTIKGMCRNKATVLTEVYYMCFGNEIAKIMRKHSGNILCQEINLAYDKWKARGLDTSILDAIMINYCSGCIIVTNNVGVLNVADVRINPSTEDTLLLLKAQSLLLATELTLSALSTKITACNTGAVVVSSGTITPQETIPIHISKMNPSLALTWTAGELTQLVKTISGTPYTKTLTWIAGELTAMSAWS